MMNQAVILAAGAGIRLKSVSTGVPKCLLKIGGRLLIEHQLEVLRQCGIERVCVVVGHQADHVRSAVSPTCHFITNARYAETNSLYSLWLARRWVSGPFILLNGDVLAHPDIYHRILACNGAALAYDSCSGHEAEHMKVGLNATRVSALSKSLHASDTHGENVGILKFDAAESESLFCEAEELIANGKGERQWAPAAVDRMARKTIIRGVDVADLPWIEIDFPDDLVRAERDIWPLVGPLYENKSHSSKRWRPCHSPAPPRDGENAGSGAVATASAG